MCVSFAACLEFVVSNLMDRNPDRLEHPGAGLDHHRRTTQIVLDRNRFWMISQILVVHDLMNEANMSLPFVLIQRRRQRQVEAEI